MGTGGPGSLSVATGEVVDGLVEASRPVTVKVPALDYACLVVVAAFDEVQVSDWIRQSVDRFFDHVTADEVTLRARVGVARKRQQDLFETLERVLWDPGEAESTPLPPVRKQEPGAKKGLTVRLGAHHLHRCASLAMLDGTSVSEQVRFSIDHALGERIGDAAARTTFVERADESRSRARSALGDLLR